MLGDTWENQKYELFDTSDPALGFAITYDNGDNLLCPTKRKFSINLRCNSRNYNIPETSLVQESLCWYNITIDSIFACPNSCSIAENILCSENGKCHYDIDSGFSHCYCNPGYYGSACSSTNSNSSSFSITSYILLAMTIVLALMFIVL